MVHKHMPICQLPICQYSFLLLFILLGAFLYQYILSATYHVHVYFEYVISEPSGIIVNMLVAPIVYLSLCFMHSFRVNVCVCMYITSCSCLVTSCHFSYCHMYFMSYCVMHCVDIFCIVNVFCLIYLYCNVLSCVLCLVFCVLRTRGQ